jgi:hypothetical protein
VSGLVCVEVSSIEHSRALRVQRIQHAYRYV